MTSRTLPYRNSSLKVPVIYFMRVLPEQRTTNEQKQEVSTSVGNLPGNIKAIVITMYARASITQVRSCKLKQPVRN
ncbi:unnamed protein product [Ixodes pacificus]